MTSLAPPSRRKEWARIHPGKKRPDLRGRPTTSRAATLPPLKFLSNHEADK